MCGQGGVATKMVEFSYWLSSKFLIWKFSNKKIEPN